MDELRAIIDAHAQACRAGKRSVLATVVRTSGSVYRRAGARMLVVLDADGDNPSVTGAISGGCLEADVCERARAVALHGASVLVRYDTTAASDIVWGLGLGCNGVVEVLLERADDAPGSELMRFLARCSEQRARGAIATVFCVADKTTGATQSGEARNLIGARQMLDDSGILSGQHLCSALTEDLHAAISNAATYARTYTTALNTIEVFVETIEPPIKLIIFGAGADAVPVVRLAHQLGWHVTVVDHRAGFVTRERFHLADEIILARPDQMLEQVALNEKTCAIVMTHSFEHDRRWLRMLLPSAVRYIGCLGPARRTERMLLEMAVEEGNGFVPTDKQLARLHAPVGLDIGAETPEEIAVSIIAEVRASLSYRSGGSLKHRRGPIHDISNEKSDYHLVDNS